MRMLFSPCQSALNRELSLSAVVSSSGGMGTSNGTTARTRVNLNGIVDAKHMVARDLYFFGERDAPPGR